MNTWIGPKPRGFDRDGSPLGPHRGNNLPCGGILFPMSFSRARALVLASLWLAGCAASPTRPGAPPGPPVKPIEVAEIVVSPFSESELEAQFERARSLLLGEKFKESSEIFDRLVRLAPGGEVAPPSLYNGAIAREGLADRAGAIERYRQLLQRFPDHATARSAQFRLLRLHGYLEQWSDLVAAADKIIARKDLSVLEAIEARGARSLGLVEQDRLDEAAREVGLARDIIEDRRLGESGKPPIELAQVSFALGEVRRKRSEKITFDPVTPNFTDVLEQRCQGLLDAQSAYADAMRAYDAHWSAMAGYRVGQLYQQLHRDLMRVPPPIKADTLKKKQLFEGAMRLRYRVLLEKGLKMMDGTVRMGQRTGEDSSWVQRAREAKRDIELSLDDEKAALAKLPYTEEELEAALELLKKK
jgi:tetratricopeptide (TPR) repeat protein